MNRFIRYWNQNRKKIIITVAIIAFIIIIIRIINGLYAQLNNKKTIQNKANDTLEPTKSIITGEIISEEVTKVNTNEVENFVNYCNNKEYSKAYELLTDDCKAEYGNDINNFIQQYIKKIFSKDRTYEIELWLVKNNEYTYRVTFYENNILASGGSNISKNFEDYVTITNREGITKISIDCFIRKENIKKSIDKNNIEIIVNNKKVYTNYEVYNITVKNKTSNNIMLANISNNEDICLIDEKKVKYEFIQNGTTQEDLVLNTMQEKNLNIRFSKIYSTYSREIEEIEFNNIISDYERYKKDSKDETIQKYVIGVTIK